MDHPAATGSVEIPTHSLDELLATKLRAYTQRDKGRDLFDLWWAKEHATVDPAEVVRLYCVYVTKWNAGLRESRAGHLTVIEGSAPRRMASTSRHVRSAMIAARRPRAS